MNTPHVVTLVGGYASMAANFELHLAEWGIEVVQHIEYLPLRVPTRTTMLIVLKSACCHSLSSAAQLVSTKRQIPIVVVDHHWTQAEAVLRQNGILDPTDPPVVDQGAPYWLEAKVHELGQEVTRLKAGLSQAEDLLLEQQCLLDDLWRERPRQARLTQFLQVLDDPRQSMTLAQLRQYATYEVGLVGASKVKGGKMALLQKIQQVTPTGDQPERPTRSDNRTREPSNPTGDRT